MLRGIVIRFLNIDTQTILELTNILINTMPGLLLALAADLTPFRFDFLLFGTQLFWANISCATPSVSLGPLAKV